jgi:hypothetical protein
MVLKSEAGKASLFNLAADPAETVDIAQRESDVLTQLRSQYQALSTRRQRPRPLEPLDLDPATRESLRALGYVE